jgi:signal transduction protein with GAF and PtsI domain
VFEAPPVQGVWRRLGNPDDVLALMDTTAEGVVACVADAGATFLAPIFDELTAVVCLSGTPLSHIGIVSREYQVPCVMSAVFAGGEPSDGDVIEVDCSGSGGIVRRVK